MQLQTSFRITPQTDVTKIQTMDGIGQSAVTDALRVAGKNGKAVLIGFFIDGKYKKVVLESHWKRTIVKK